MDAIAEAYRRGKVPVDAALQYPVEAVIDRLDVTSLQLWHSAPTQYQEYDRLRAEAAFRVGVALPLAAASLIGGVLISGVLGFSIGAIGLLGAFVMVIQARVLDHRRDVLMATVISQGLVHDSLLESVVAELERLKLPSGKEYASFHHALALAVAFDKVGAYEYSDGAAAGAGWEAREYAEITWTREELEVWLEAASHMAQEILRLGDSDDLFLPFGRGLDSVRKWWDSSAGTRAKLIEEQEARSARSAGTCT